MELTQKLLRCPCDHKALAELPHLTPARSSAYRGPVHRDGRPLPAAQQQKLAHSEWTLASTNPDKATPRYCPSDSNGNNSTLTTATGRWSRKCLNSSRSTTPVRLAASNKSLGSAEATLAGKGFGNSESIRTRFRDN